MNDRVLTPARNSAAISLSPAPAGVLHRACACGQHSHGKGQCDQCSKKDSASRRQQAAASSMHGVPSAAVDVLKAPGNPLDNPTRSFMESRFGTDFSRVRVHNDGTASAAARSINALAYTSGTNIVFGAGQYTPGTAKGQRLLAHELAHVVQQRIGPAPAPQTAKAVSQPGDASEREAVAAADRVLLGEPAQVSSAPSAVLQGSLGDAIGIGVGIAGSAALLALAIAGVFRNRWRISQHNTDGTNYSSDVNITFNPDNDANCDEIAFVQSVKFSDASSHTSVETIPNYVQRRTATGWTLDRIQARKHGWYGYNNNGRPGGNVSPGRSPSPKLPATMHDAPSDTRPSSVMEFETCAICRSGTDLNKIYSCFHWGFSVDASNKVTSLPTTEAEGPTADFNESLKQWNIQAAGPAANRNDPAQQKLGPLHQ